MNKLALGTVQFGMKYGINNQTGQVGKKDVLTMLRFAGDNGIDVLDTAHAYGESETVLGETLPESGHTFRIVSKYPAKPAGDPDATFNSTLRRLKLESIYGYLFHDFKTCLDHPEILDRMAEWKSAGKVEKTGFSIYYPSELDTILEKGFPFQLIQFPYSVFDQRFRDYIPRLHSQGVEIHVRSVFLQGLVFMNPGEMHPRFKKIKNKLLALREISGKNGIPLPALCLNFAAANPGISRVVMGVDNPDNLRENISDLSYLGRVEKLLPELAGLREDDEQVILPVNWK